MDNNSKAGKREFPSRRDIIAAAGASVVAIMPWGASAMCAKTGSKNPNVDLDEHVDRIERVDPFIGEYQGEFKPSDGKAVLAAGQVFAEGDGKYTAYLLPGQNLKDGVKLSGKSKVIPLQGRVEKGNDKIEIAGGGWSGTLSSDAISARSEDGKFELKYTVRKSPTLEAEPPKNATVLLPYKPGKKTSLDAWSNKKWKILPDGSIQVNKGSNYTTEEFGSFRLHVEFRIPYEPKKRSQGRGNSGVYIQERYEVQVLDSFGRPVRVNGCGALYREKAPAVNACLPPGRWQTYDIVFRAAEVNNGKIIKPAEFTVRHNGIMIHDEFKMHEHTGMGKRKKPAQTGRLQLQDHGHPVRYRNIWLVKL